MSPHIGVSCFDASCGQCLVAKMAKALACNAGRPGFDPRFGKIPLEKENGIPLQCSCLEKIPWTEERGRLTVHGITKSQT